jgi:hypothetical protein
MERSAVVADLAVGEEQEVTSARLPEGSFGKRARSMVDAGAEGPSTSLEEAVQVQRTAQDAAVAGAVPLGSETAGQLPPMDKVMQYIWQEVLSPVEGKDSLAVAKSLCRSMGVADIKYKTGLVKLVSRGWTSWLPGACSCMHTAQPCPLHNLLRPPAAGAG